MSLRDLGDYVRHAKRFGIEGILEAAEQELSEQDVERLRHLLAKRGSSSETTRQSQ